MSLSGTTRPCLILDGVDGIEGVGPRRAINDLLGAISRLRKDANGASRWGELITLRSEQLDAVSEWIELSGRDIKVVHVPGLSEAELAALSTYRPHLGKILASPQVGPVVHNPYFLQTLEKARGREVETPGRPVTEAEVHELWWSRFVGRNQDRGRQQILLQFGEEWLRHHRRRFPNRALAPEVLHGLEKDAILRHRLETDSFVFGHDILEEWAAVRVLGQKEPDVLGYLQQLENPFWARRPVQLLACLRLEGENGVERWRDLLIAAEELPEASSRWTDAVLTAPFRSARLQELMPGVGEVLLENGGARLLHFLRALRTQAIKANRALERMSREASARATPRGEAMLLEFGEPEEAQWIPVLSWLTPRLLDLPDPFKEEASKIMAIWERATRSGGPFRREIAEAALTWRAPLRPIDGRRSYIDRETELYFNRLRDIAALSADAIPEIFAHLLEAEANDSLRRWLAAGSVLSLVEQAPAAYANFTLDVLVPEWRQERLLQQKPNVHLRSSYW